ncbi:ArsR/SmtB family transcription factor [Actinomadura rudentiformis]|uniref:Winged helix-turn-helix transcriptional regulator n=1 Tax=Actinomadura rudentiformis TaxID=359158 RepID=A0A6H9YG50_9ACTN|nr:metalloregulator ArsR/SmtB family transcription factor [Actinomadura rudentiformis]KAB2343734.1 winged helix-turn-helix transcriptional regulator [Actinomadura rudentiformis]
MNPTPALALGRADGPAECTHTDTVATFFRALADPTRLKLMEFILGGERTSADCVAHAGISQPRVSVHLSCLVDCGYVTARRDGKKLRYSIGDPRVADLVVLARALAADNAAALACCPRISPAPRPHPRQR